MWQVSPTPPSLQTLHLKQVSHGSILNWLLGSFLSNGDIWWRKDNTATVSWGFFAH